MDVYTFHLINTSSEALVDLSLDTTLLPTSVQACNILRERGSLQCMAPFDTLPLGNLYPDESMIITFSVVTSEEASPFDANLSFMRSLLQHAPLPTDTPLDDLISILEE